MVDDPAPASEYADAHADATDGGRMPCPHCGLGTPRDSHYCVRCGWDIVRGLPHQAPPGTTSSSGRKLSAQQRAQIIASFSETPSIAGGRTLAERLDLGDKLLATLERDAERADTALREVLAARFKAAEGEDLPETVRSAQQIAARRAPTGAALDDVKALGAAYRDWTAASDALTAARAQQNELLERWHEQRLGR